MRNCHRANRPVKTKNRCRARIVHMDTTQKLREIIMFIPTKYFARKGTKEIILASYIPNTAEIMLSLHRRTIKTKNSYLHNTLTE
jgi:hypothetical protein